MRRTAALLLVPLLLLPACGNDGSTPTVSGKFGDKPKVTAPDGKPGTQLEVTVLDEGGGAVIKKGELLVADYLGQTWRDGRVFDNSYDKGVPVGFPIGVGGVIKGWDEGLVGKKVGSRVLLVIPPSKGYGPEGNPQAGINGDDTLVFVIDLRGSHDGKAEAEGKQSSAGGERLPTVSTTQRGPVITIPKGVSPPTKLIAQNLVEGTGPAVRKEQLLVVQYVGVTWRGARKFDASWDRHLPAGVEIGTGGVIKGWDEGLVGKRLGSRVLLVIPPDKGYGPQGNPQARIKGDDTLVFAVDLLGAY